MFLVGSMYLVFNISNVTDICRIVGLLDNGAIKIVEYLEKKFTRFISGSPIFFKEKTIQKYSADFWNWKISSYKKPMRIWNFLFIYLLRCFLNVRWFLSFCSNLSLSYWHFMVHIKPFHVVRTIFSNIILDENLLWYLCKQTSYWSKTGFFSVCQLKK